MSSFGDGTGSDDEYSGPMGKRRNTHSKNAGSDDDLWSDLASKNPSSSRSSTAARDRANNPFIIHSSVCFRSIAENCASCARVDGVSLQATPKSGASTGDVDAIPIDSLGGAGVDASIFKDFGADSKKKNKKGEPVTGTRGFCANTPWVFSNLLAFQTISPSRSTVLLTMRMPLLALCHRTMNLLARVTRWLISISCSRCEAMKSCPFVNITS